MIKFQRFRHVILLIASVAIYYSCSESTSEEIFDDPDLLGPDGELITGPLIDTIVPSSAYIGDTVIIKGKNFSTDTSVMVVSFAGPVAQIISASESELQVLVPLEASSTGIVNITVNGEFTRADFGFTVIQPPFDLYSMSPKEGSAGQVIRITGSVLPDDPSLIKVFFDESLTGEVTYLSGPYLDVLVPYNTKSGRFVLEIDGYLALSPHSFEYIEGGTWERLGEYSDPPTGNMVGFVINDNIYLGLGHYYEYLKTFYQFDPTENTFTPLAEFPGNGRSGAFTFAYNGKGYVGSGFRGFGNYESDVYSYDPGADKWTRLTDFPGEPRKDAVSFVVGDKGYVGLGSHGGKDFWEYDFLLDVWTQIKDFPGASRQGAGSFIIDNIAYVYGGLGNGVYNDLWSFDPVTAVWKQQSNSLTEGQADMVAFSIGDKGYMACGWDFEGNSPTSKMRQTFEYDPATDTWKRLSNFYDPGISNTLSLSTGGHAYVFTGEFNKNYYRFTPD